LMVELDEFELADAHRNWGTWSPYKD